MQLTERDKKAIADIRETAQKLGLDISQGKVQRSSSRFCLGVEHGDYNGTELFGVGTDRFIWLAYKPNKTGKIRAYSLNFPDDGLVECELATISQADSDRLKDSWARFVYGAGYILQQEGYNLTEGMDAVIYGDIPGGGMSRSASLSLNLIVSILDVNGIEAPDKLKVAKIAQAVENKFIGSPCGLLDQVMIIHARRGMGVLYNPRKDEVSYIPAGKPSVDFRLVCLDTGTTREGLEKSTYKIRRAECEELVEILKRNGYDITCLADIKDQQLYEQIQQRFKSEYPNHCKRLKYIFEAQQRFYKMLEAWRAGDIETVGQIFRQDGIGLRDDYEISGPELETMCDIARQVPAVLGERMLGGGDKGASGAIVRTDGVEELKRKVDELYPKAQPAYADKYAVYCCDTADGIVVFEGVL